VTKSFESQKKIPIIKLSACCAFLGHSIAMTPEAIPLLFNLAVLTICAAVVYLIYRPR
jgi:hypothetical protein